MLLPHNLLVCYLNSLFFVPKPINTIVSTEHFLKHWLL